MINRPAKKILQTDPRLNKHDNLMAESGCFFRVDLAIAETKVGMNLTADEINKLREILTNMINPVNNKQTVIRKDDLFINNHEVVINAALELLGASDIKAKHLDTKFEEGEPDATINVTRTNIGVHAREGDQYGNVIFDPDPTIEGNGSYEKGIRGIKFEKVDQKDMHGKGIKNGDKRK